MGAGGFVNLSQDSGLSDQTAFRGWLKKMSASLGKKCGDAFSVYSCTSMSWWETSAQQRILWF